MERSMGNDLLAAFHLAPLSLAFLLSLSFYFQHFDREIISDTLSS